MKNENCLIDSVYGEIEQFNIRMFFTASVENSQAIAIFRKGLQMPKH